jgi:hypothetical protein
VPSEANIEPILPILGTHTRTGTRNPQYVVVKSRSYQSRWFGMAICHQKVPVEIEKRLN